jgi:hypothetical protein
MRLARRTNLQRIASAVLAIGLTSTSLAWARGSSTRFNWWSLGTSPTAGTGRCSGHTPEVPVSGLVCLGLERFEHLAGGGGLTVAPLPGVVVAGRASEFERSRPAGFVVAFPARRSSLRSAPAITFADRLSPGTSPTCAGCARFGP